MMMNFEKSVKICFAVGMVLLATCAVAATTQFTKGKSWLSKNTYYPAQTQNATPANPSGRTKLMAASNSNANDGCRVFDVSIAMYRERTEEERAKINFIITNFAYAVYEATDGRHKIGKVTMLPAHAANVTDIVWQDAGRPSSSVRSVASVDNNTSGCFERTRQIKMFDAFMTAQHEIQGWYLSNEQNEMKGGFTLGHEWSHYCYGLLDEYKEDNPKKEGKINQPHKDDLPVVPSIMNNQGNAIRDGKMDFSWLNYSISYSENSNENRFRNTRKTAQHRVYGQSCWEQLKYPKTGKISDDSKSWTSWFKAPTVVWAITPYFEEFSDKNSDNEPSIEFDVSSPVEFTAAAKRATSALEIIWDDIQYPFLMISIDTSGSMSTSDMSNVKDRAQEILSRVSEGTVVGVSTFTTSVSEVVPLTKVTEENRATLKAKIAALPSSGSGGTDIWDAAWDGLEQIATYDPQKANAAKTTLMVNALTATTPSTVHNYGVASLILLTDGENGSSSHSKAQVIARCNEMGVAFNSIGYGSNADKSLRDVSEGTGGQQL